MSSTPKARRDYRTHVETIPADQRWTEHRIILRLLDDIAQIEALVDELVREDSLPSGSYTVLRRLRDVLAGADRSVTHHTKPHHHKATP